MKSNTEEFTKVAFTTLQINQNNSNPKSQVKKNKTKLIMFGKGITYIKNLDDQKQYFANIKELDLSHNAISNIQNLKILQIEELNLSHNKILEQERVFQIFVQQKNNQIAKSINKLCLKGNPFLKKPLNPKYKRWLLSIQNDLDFFSKQQMSFFQQLAQKQMEKICLHNIQNKILISIQLSRRYELQPFQSYSDLLLMKPQSVYRIIRRQLQKKLSQSPIYNLKKSIAGSLSLQLFIGKQRMQTKSFGSSLTRQLHNRGQLIGKQIKQLSQKIHSNISSLIALKKINFQKKQKQPKSFQFTKNYSKNQIKSQQYFFPLMTTPQPRQKSPIKIRKIVSSQIEPLFQFNLPIMSDQNELFKQSVKSDRRNPFQQLLHQQLKRQNPFKNLNSKENSQNRSLQRNSMSKSKKIDIKNTSKTLFQLSQSLMKKPMNSGSSLNLSIQQLSENSIEKMFYQILIKTNPIYNLLYSPLQSLKSTQKDSLINNLLDLLKQKLKYVQKLQKIKYIGQEQKVKMDQMYKKLNLEIERAEITSYRLNEQNRRLQMSEIEIQKLSKQLQAKTQQNMSLKQQNATLRQKIQSESQIQFNEEYEQQCFQKIRSKTENQLKNKYFKLLILKSNKLYQFQEKINQIHQNQNQKILQLYFHKFKKQVQINKKQQYLIKRFLFKHTHQFAKTLQSSVSIKFQNQKKSILVEKYLKQFFILDFKQKIIGIRTNKQKSYKSQLHYELRLKISLFNILKENYQNNKSIIYQKMIEKFKKSQQQKLKSLVFQQWLIWQKGLIHKEIQIKVNHQGTLACYIIKNLCQFYSQSKSYRLKQVGLSLFLRDIRRINSFHQFHKNVALQTQKKKLKLFKINFFTKRMFFEDFLEGVNKMRLKRKMNKRDELKTKRKLQLNELNEFKLRNIMSINKTKKKLRRSYFQFIKKRIVNAKNQIQLQNNNNSKKISIFFQRFGLLHKNISDFKQKNKQLYYLKKQFKSNQCNNSQFSPQKFFLYLKKQYFFKKRLKSYFIKKNKNLLNKTFYLFKMVCLKERSQYFEEKLKQLGPDIQLIQQRQIQTNIQKVSLLRQLELKNNQLQEYQKQINQLKLLLQVKQVKYQKLKDIYAESIEINSREREIYGDLYNKNPMNICLPEQTHYIYDNLKLSYGKEDHYFNKTLKIDSKLDFPQSKISSKKYSPQKDIKTSIEKSKVNDYVVENKLIHQQNDLYNQKSYNQKRNSYQDIKNGKMSEFYPSFRRF